MYLDPATETVWEQLRATRWNPPAGVNASGERRTTYVFALEQAEQLLRSAAMVGTATRPLPVFYGLSQAGRAIAAASSLASGDEWKLKGHGVTSLGLDGPLPEVEVRTGEQPDPGSFVRLSALLHSPLWGKAPVRLNELWDLLPENEQSPLVESGKLRRTPLLIDHRALHSEPHPLASVPVIGFPPWLINAADGRAALNDYLRAFPEAQGYDGFVRLGMEPDAAPSFTHHRDGWGELYMHWHVPEGCTGTYGERLALIETLTRPYDGMRYFFPAIGPTGRSLHPLMAWWSVLHALSMLARYQPAEWAGHINVDTSPHAVGIERLLKEAIRILPRLVAETIDQVMR